MASSHTLDMTTGSITKKVISFTLPVLCTLLLQQLYTIADKAVVGQFASNGMQALAAVGATSSIVAMCLNFTSGLAAAVNVRCANLKGSRDEQTLRKSMHTSVLVSVVLGLLCGGLIMLLSRPLLRLLDTPEELIDLSDRYLKIYMAGLPATVIYNFGAGILRAYGDTKRPMYILLITGFVNVVLNLIFVLAFDMSVEGVALSTLIAQIISAVWVLIILFAPKDNYKLTFGELQIHGKSVKEILRLGIPGGFNGMMFSLANMVLQASVNSFQDTAIIAGKAAAMDAGELVSQIQYAFGIACLSFAGQCYGAGNFKRIDKMLLKSIPLCCVMMSVATTVYTVFPGFVIGIFNSDPAVVAAGKNLLIMTTWGYLLFAVSQLFYNASRGMGASIGITMMNMISIILPRLIWVWVFFPMKHDIVWLYVCYPVSWFISAVTQGFYYVYYRKKAEQKMIKKISVH